MDPNHSIGRRLPEIAAWRGMSLRAVAQLAGMMPGHLSNIVNGTTNGAPRFPPVESGRRRRAETMAHAAASSRNEFTPSSWRPMS